MKFVIPFIKAIMIGNLTLRSSITIKVKTNIISEYHFKKVSKIVAGGKERYNSVYNGIQAITVDENHQFENTYVFIHDGARPCVSAALLARCLDTVKETNACVAAVPVKDTIKIVDTAGYAISTPDRKSLWQIQTPQVFSYEVIKNAYDTFIHVGSIEGITDDAMVVEQYSNIPVKMVEGSYNNIKVTTQEDIQIVESYLRKTML
jgi:2-C-methyl-D-erythritol 4-phosphate cytidylyltransferase